MKLDEPVAVRRLVAQRLVGERFPSAAEAVRQLLAVQSQDYAGARATGRRRPSTFRGGRD